MKEAGYDDFVFETYCALMAPAKIPPEARDKLEKVALDILSRPEMRQKLTQIGLRGDRQGRQGHLARITKEVPMFKDIIVKARIKQQGG